MTWRQWARDWQDDEHWRHRAGRRGPLANALVILAALYVASRLGLFGRS